MTTVYKVVRVTGKRKPQLTSLIDTDWSKLKIVYQPNIWVKPEVGKIFAFEDINEAIDWCENVASYWWGNHIEIWEAEAEGIESCTAVLPDMSLRYRPRGRLEWVLNAVVNFWRDPQKPWMIPPVYRTWHGRYLPVSPQGTIAVDAIKLVKRVYP